MIKLAVLGATGRMGTRVLQLLQDDARFELTAALTCTDDPRVGEAAGDGKMTFTSDCEAAFDVMIDFSLPAATVQWLETCRERRAALVSGTTGLTAEQSAMIDRASCDIAILRASNFSVGVNLLLGLVREAAQRLGEAYNIEIVEHHHNRKVDAPSGTALALLGAVVEARARDAADTVHGRHGVTGPRNAREIGMHALRMGDVIGHHEVHFGGPGETVTLQHTALSREAFARGALEAAAWIADQEPGRYSMQHVLPLSPGAR